MRRATGLRLGAVGVLLLGLGLAVGVYLAPGPRDPQAYDLEGGQAFESSPWDSRSYRRSLEYIGGKQALFFSELRESLAGLLGGAPLALAVGGLGAGCAFWLLRAAERADRTHDRPDQ